MGRTVTITTVRVLLGKPTGCRFPGVRGGNGVVTGGSASDAYASDAGGQVSVHLTRPARGRYVLIWFTQLPRGTSGTFQATVYNVSLEGWA